MDPFLVDSSFLRIKSEVRAGIVNEVRRTLRIDESVCTTLHYNNIISLVNTRDII